LNANVVAENTAKPQSDIVYLVKTVVAETIATYFKCTRQTYDDLPQLASEIETKGIYAVRVKEDQQLLKGTGTGGQLQGVYPIATALTATPPAGANLYDLILLATAQLGAAGFSATGAIVSQADATTLAMVKDTQGQYVRRPEFAVPQIAISPSLAATEWVVGDFARGVRIFERETVNVQVASQNEDDFLKNKVTVLIELREAVAILQASAFVKNGP
jgi:HK97 family phage major capsid protein